MKPKSGLSLVLATLAVLCLAGTSFGNIVTNGDFETGDLTGWTQAVSTGWVITTGTAPPNPDDQYIAQQTHSAAFPLSQDLTTVDGHQYTLDLWVKWDPYGSYVPTTGDFFTATLGGATLISVDAAPGDLPTGWQELSATVTVSGTTNTLEFNAAAPDVNEWSIDDVSVEDTTPTPTPEPASLGLLGLGAAAFLLRRKK